MSFRMYIAQKIFNVSILQIGINAKFKCQLDIFIKNGSQKEELYQGLKIQNCKVNISDLKSKTLSKSQVSFKNNSKSSKNSKNCSLIFQLRSKSYNAYAGQIQLDFSTDKKTKYQCKIQNCVDQNAYIKYQISKYNLVKSKSQSQLMIRQDQQKPKINIKKPLDQQNIKTRNKYQKIEQSSNLKKKTATSVQNQNFRMNFKSMQKSSILNSNTNTPFSIQTPLEKSMLLINENSEMSESKILEGQEYSQINNKNLRKSQNQNSMLLNSNQKKKGRLLNSISSTPQITKKIIQLQKRLDQQKQKSLRHELELQSKKLQIKQLTKSSKTYEKKFQSLQVQYKKTKKQQNTFTKQNQQLRDYIENLKQKLNQKSQQVNFLNKRSINKDRSYKQQLQNVYKKLYSVSKEKQFKNYQNVGLEQRIQKFEKKMCQEYQEKDEQFEIQKLKLQKNLKKTEKQLDSIKEFFIRSSKEFAKQIQQILKNQKIIKNKNFVKNSMLQSISFQSSTTSYSYQSVYQHQLNRQCLAIFKQLTVKVQRIANQLHSNIAQKTQTIQLNQKQIYGLKIQLRQLCMQIENLQIKIQKENQNHQVEISKFEQLLENERKQNFQKIKQLKNQIKDNECQIQELNDGMLIRNREISSLKILSQQLQTNIQKMNQEMQQKSNEYKESMNKMLKQKQQLTKNFRSEILQLESTLQKQKFKSSQLKQQTINLKHNIEILQAQISTSNQRMITYQKDLKSAQQSNQLMVKQATQLKNMINQITGFSTKKQKQMNNQNNALSQQVNNFKQNYKSLQQTKNQIQSQLSKMQSQLIKSKQQRSRMQQEYKKIQKVFNITQKSSNSLTKFILDMKKQNQDLKQKLKKKIQFEQQLQDQFQCKFYQIREKLQFYINHNREMQKQKNNTEREGNLKLRKLTAYIESVTSQLNIVNEYTQKLNADMNKIPQIIADFKKTFNTFEKEGSLPTYYSNQFRDKITMIDKIYEEIAKNYQNLEKILQGPRKNRSKNSVNLRRSSTTENLNQSMMKRSMSIVNLNTTQEKINTENPNPQNNNKPLTRINSVITSFQTLNRKKEEIQNDRIASHQDYINSQPTDQNNKKQHSFNQDSISQTQIQKKPIPSLKRLPSKIRPMKINTNMQRIQQKPQNYTPTPIIEHQKKRTIKRLNTLK